MKTDFHLKSKLLSFLYFQIPHVLKFMYDYWHVCVIQGQTSEVLYSSQMESILTLLKNWNIMVMINYVFMQDLLFFNLISKYYEIHWKKAKFEAGSKTSVVLYICLFLELWSVPFTSYFDGKWTSPFIIISLLF